MAGKKSTPKKTSRNKKQNTPAYYPVQRKIPLGVFDSAIGAITVADAGQLLSIANRRMMRYGMNYQIKIDLEPIVGGSAVDYQVDVYALMNNWDVQRAFALAKDTWTKAHANEMESQARTSRWLDFRVRHGVDSAVVLNPVRYNNDTLAAIVTDDGEHADSSVDDAGTEKFFTWGANSATELDLFEEWQHYGRTEDDPSSASANAPYGGVNSDTESDIEYVNVQNDGNSPPYASASHGDYLVKVATLRYERLSGGQPVGMQRLSTGYFDAPCGLFVLKQSTGGNLPNGSITMTAKAGDYKGVAAKKMCQ